jgi:hypothetical protein
MSGGPGPELETPREVRFPLRRASFVPIDVGASLSKVISARGYGFSANGWDFGADVYIGSRASRFDRSAIWRVVSSLRFPSLHTGQRTGGGGYLVLKEQDSYPVGSVERINANNFIVRGARAFYGISGRAMGTPSYFPCPLHFDRAKSEFACKSGSRRWDRMGRPLWKYTSDWDYLGVVITTVGQDGHVIYGGGIAFGTRALERQLWGRISRVR